MTANERLHFRYAMTVAVAASHLLLAVLGVFGRLNYHVYSQYPLLLSAMNNGVWVWFQILAAAAIVAALTFSRYQVTAVAASTGVMGAWAFLGFLWGSSTGLPVSLAGPVLAGVIAVMSYLLAMSWARRGDEGR